MPKHENIAAIDLGSNALRAIIARKTNNQIEVIKNYREPLRLGEEVFESGYISKEKMQLTEGVFIRLHRVFTEYEVSEVSVRATSAMRDAKNADELIERIRSSTGIEIKTINGQEEARLIYEAVKGQIPLGKKTAVLMDVGGGSTEIIIVKDNQILKMKSFDVGTVRLIQFKDQQELEKIITYHVQQMMVFIEQYLEKKRPKLFVGTGGNLRRIGKIRKKLLGKSTSQLALFSEINYMEQDLDRIRSLKLDQNRADVILPAIMLTHHLMQALKMEVIHLPKVGLKEGIILSMLEHPPKKFILKE